MKEINIKKFLIGLGLILSYILVIPGITITIFKILNLDIQNQIIYTILNLTVYLLSTIVLVIIYRKDLIKEAKLFKENLKENLSIGFKYWICAFIFMIITNLIAIALNSNIAANEEQNRMVINTFPILSIISMVFIGPFIEELLFRKGFKDVTKNENLYCFISGLLFGAAHLISSFSSGDIISNLGELLFILPYGGIGFFFAKAYYKTNTIFTSTTFHIIHNAIAVCLAMLGG